MPLGQIHHVDVVPDPGAVLGVVVRAEDAEDLKLTRGHPHDIGHEVVGNAVGIITDQAAFMRPHGIEVAQGGNPPALIAGR